MFTINKIPWKNLLENILIKHIVQWRPNWACKLENKKTLVTRVAALIEYDARNIIWSHTSGNKKNQITRTKRSQGFFWRTKLSPKTKISKQSKNSKMTKLLQWHRTLSKLPMGFNWLHRDIHKILALVSQFLQQCKYISRRGKYFSRIISHNFKSWSKIGWKLSKRLYCLRRIYDVLKRIKLRWSHMRQANKYEPQLFRFWLFIFLFRTFGTLKSNNVKNLKNILCFWIFKFSCLSPWSKNSCKEQWIQLAFLMLRSVTEWLFVSQCLLISESV